MSGDIRILMVLLFFSLDDCESNDTDCSPSDDNWVSVTLHFFRIGRSDATLSVIVTLFDMTALERLNQKILKMRSIKK